jgi:oxygen-dependent protoporphyrinogen oxidase
MNGKKVAIVGAGFSGMTLAWALQKDGFQVEVFEEKGKAGGLIQTNHSEVMVETAAHALLNSQDVEELFRDLGIKMVQAGYRSNSKWIFRGEPRKWPLTWSESLKSIGFPRKAQPGQSVEDWAKKNLSEAFNHYLLSPALQGVYGVPSRRLSAQLILRGFRDRATRPPRSKFRGSVAPAGGMIEIFEKLSQKIHIHFNSQKLVSELKDQFDAVVIATSLHQARELIKPQSGALSEALGRVPFVSLTSVTIGLDRPSARPAGFGCLFPQSEKFESLGVLFNSDIFEGRGAGNETWIFGSDLSHLSGQQILNLIFKDRKKLDPTSIDIRYCEIHRWPQVLPLYGFELEMALSSEFWKVDPFRFGAALGDRTYLTGNYLGGIGLSKILTYNKRLTQKVKEDLL